MYCFATSETTGNTATYTTAQILAAIQDGTVGSLTDVTSGLAFMGGGSSDVINGTWSTKADSVSGTAIIIDTMMPGEEVKYYMVLDSGTVSGFDENPDLIFNVSAADAEWKSVPEPTSGLLLLIGVAGLALRRRRA